MKDFTQLADLASERLGGRVLDANDDFFAPKENIPPVENGWTAGKRAAAARRATIGASSVWAFRV